MSKIRFVGLDVHADTIAVAVAELDGEVRPMGIIPNRPESIRKLAAKLGPVCVVRSADPTRVISPRHLPTDHDDAVSTRGY